MFICGLLLTQLPPEEKPATEDARTDTVYYQWIPFMLVLNGIVFLIPGILWKLAQGTKEGKGFVRTFIIRESRSKYVSTNLDPDCQDTDLK